MDITAEDRSEFAPPPQPGMLRAFVLAVIAHLLLLAALTWGVRWKNESEDRATEAELWSANVQQAAPRAVAPPPAPAPAPVPTPAPPPPPPPPPAPRPAPPPPPPAPAKRDADIALEREKERKAAAAEREERQQEIAREKKLEAQKELEARKRADAQKLAEQKKREALKKQEEEEERREALAAAAAAEKKAAAAQAAKAAAAQAAKAAAAAAAAREKAEEARLEALRQDNLRRMQGLASATGGAEARGEAQRASGPSESYGGRIRARVRPNIVFTDDVRGNPTAEVEVRMAPDGTITSRRIVKSSGVKSWDEAVLRALDRTEVLPRDQDGRVHSPLLIAFRPKD